MECSGWSDLCSSTVHHCIGHTSLTSASFSFVIGWHRWFHGRITRQQAEDLLQPPSDGLFVVRESTSFPGDYTLCVSFDNKVEHYHIMYKDTKLTIDEEECFENLNQLIEVRIASGFSLFFCLCLENASAGKSVWSFLFCKAGKELNAGKKGFLSRKCMKFWDFLSRVCCVSRMYSFAFFSITRKMPTGCAHSWRNQSQRRAT